MLLGPPSSSLRFHWWFSFALAAFAITTFYWRLPRFLLTILDFISIMLFCSLLWIRPVAPLGFVFSLGLVPNTFSVLA